jgi:hypothetical protein
MMLRRLLVRLNVASAAERRFNCGIQERRRREETERIAAEEIDRLRRELDEAKRIKQVNLICLEMVKHRPIGKTVIKDCRLWLTVL